MSMSDENVTRFNRAGTEKIIAEHGSVAGINWAQPHDDQGLALERIHLLLIDEAKRGLADINAGRTCDADTAIAQIQQHRTGQR